MIALLFIWNLMAQDILVQGPNVSDVQFEKHLMENPEWVSYSQFFQRQDETAHEKLLQDFKQAQFEFLKGSLEKSKQLFESIGDRQHDHLWPSKLQKIIHYSFLRTAQLDREKSSYWLHQALLFNPNLTIDHQLFPPPLVEEYESLKMSHPLQVWSFPEGSNQFRSILINGRPVGNRSKFFRYRKGTVRLDFVSNQWQPVKIVSPLSQLEDSKVSAHPLAQGSCYSPQFHTLPSTSGQFRLYDGTCVSQSSTSSTQKKNKDLKLPSLAAKPTRPHWYKNRWLWAGVSLVATGFVVHSLNQQKNGGDSSSASNSPQEFRNN